MRCRANLSTLPIPELRLYHSPRKCARFLKRHGIPFEPIRESDAQTWTFYDDGTSYAVVLYESGTTYEYWEDMGMLAHEATHIAIYALGSIGEDEPAEEEMCYVVQAITTWLCKEHFRWKEKRVR